MFLSNLKKAAGVVFKIFFHTSTPTKSPVTTKRERNQKFQSRSQWVKRKPLRRIIQRRAKCYKWANTLERARPLLQKAYHTRQYCLKTFGFQANAKLQLQQNFKSITQNLNTNPLQQPTNLTFHNLWKETKLPTGTKALLGLNLKYCLSNNNINQDINKTLLNMAYSICTKCHLEATGYADNSNFEKQIYTKNKNWNPDTVLPIMKEKLTKFERALNKQQKKVILKKQQQKSQ